MRRVAVTGLGVISPIGLNSQEFWQSLLRGRSGIGPIESVNCDGLRFANAAEVRGFDPLLWLDAKQASQMDRSAQMAVAAAVQAAESSAIAFDPLRSAVVTGCSVGGQPTEDSVYRQLYEEKKTRFDPLTIPRIMGNAAASWISMRFGIQGPCFNVSTACASAAHAMGHAFWMIRSGSVDTALTGGTEAPITFSMLRGWEAMRVVAPDTCRPFSRDRRGMILAEGAAFFVLEDMGAARARGANIIAEICGFGMSADASHLTLPSSSGAALAMRQALEDARMPAADVGYINAHGTGTPANDPAEVRSIRSVFAAPPPISSTKSMHGHALGAGPALEALATVLALQHGVLPPTANFNEPDPDCDVDVIPNAVREQKARAALSNSFAFGGLNAVLAFRAF